jgi:hypothetical protein
MFMTYEQQISPRTPVREITSILDDVIYLTELGILSEGRSTALIGWLEAGIKQLNIGNVGAAIAGLSAFISEVRSQIQWGMLSREEGKSLIDAASDIIRATR